MKERKSLGFFPTPLHKLDRLSARYHPYELFIKRDDQTGLASGGNKTRKLEYLIQEALEQDSRAVITMGAQQSNHCRQTAAACAMNGLECHLLLVGEPPALPDGNLLMSVILGAAIHYCGEEISQGQVDRLVKDLQLLGKNPYLIPYGGSNALGALGFADAVGELQQQLESLQLEMDYIFFASCSGGTQAGLILGKNRYNLKGTLMPVSIQKTGTDRNSLEIMVLDIVNQGSLLLEMEREFLIQDIALIRGYDEAGYGVVTHQEKQAIHELARLEGIFLDPVYTARAFYAMTDYLDKKLIEPGARVLFWHTGGLPANFHYAQKIL